MSHAAATLERAKSALVSGDTGAAKRLAKSVIAQSPAEAAAFHCLALVFSVEGDRPAATSHLRQAIELSPGQSHWWTDLGELLYAADDFPGARRAYLGALRLHPSNTRARVAYGHTLLRLHRLRSAAQQFLIAASAMAGDPAPLLGLALVYEALQDYPALAEQLEAILVLVPGDAFLRDRLTRIYAEFGEIPGAIEHSRRLIADGVATPQIRAFHVYYHLFLPNRTRAAQRDTCRRIFSSPIQTSAIQTPSLPLLSESRRKLRIGYLSGDFCSGPPFYFLSSLFAHHSLDRFGIFCYNTRPSVDDASEWYSARFHWRDCSLLNDSEMVRAISADRLDILVDLSGIMPGNRLSVFALRPAPIQATYPNCPSTTGVSGIDYIITDRTVCPSGHEDNYTETPVFLDGGYLAFSPDPVAPPITLLPALINGFITFGLFQQLAKLNPAVWDAVARILHACPNSQLLLHNSSHGFTGPAAPNCRLAFQQLADRGVPAARVRIGPQCSHSGSMALMAQADIALDSFPFQGQTTTCDCLWMGVPVVALTGHNHAARVSTSLLEHARLPQLAATTLDHYVQTALRLASDVPGLAARRLGLRSHLLSSPLLDARRLASQVETAYRRMWRSERAKNSNLKGISPLHAR